MRAETDRIWGRLAKRAQLSVEETADLLRALERWRDLAAYLASCQAATAEDLPKTASKSSKARHAAICDAAAAGLAGDNSLIKHRTDVAAARERCVAISTSLRREPKKASADAS